MTISRAQMNRQLYQMGGIGTLPMDFGQPLQVPQQPQPSFSSAQNITMNPLLNYGQPQLGGGTPLTMAGGGISRLGYQEGGMGMEQMMQDPMMQEQMMQAPMQGQMMPAAGGEEQGQTALLTIIQLLIEQGVPPEQAQEIAMQILQVFAQGGQPAVEEFANQLEQEEMSENRTMMAGGGITGIYPRQGYFFKGVVKAISGAVKGVASAVKSVAKSPIGMIALSIAAPYAIGAMFPGFATLGTASLGTFGGAALRAGISNLAIQGITTGKINPKQALMAAVGGGIAGSVFGGAGPQAGDAMYTDYGPGTSSLTSGVTDVGRGVVQPGFEPFDTGSYATNVQVGATPTISEPNFVQKGITSIKDFGTKLMDSPLQTLSGVGSDALKLVKDNKELALLGGTFALSALDQQPGESDDAYKLRAQTDPRVAQYITQYGGAAKVYSPGGSGLYAMEGAVDPFAGRSSYAANGGRIGYEDGSMPMGEPRRNPAGIMELDYRAKGGFVPPIGIKEKADDIPAMLSNNEFVFTADAVRAAGGGSVNKGAQKMYGLMKQLESGIA